MELESNLIELRRKMSRKKKFDEDLYSSNDERARATVFRYINEQGLYAVDNPDIYGPDIIVYSGLQPKYYIEVEVKQVWKNTEAGEFPYPTVQLPHRKKKFLDGPLPIEYWILSADCSHVLIIPDSVLNDSLLVEVPNKYVSEGELFYSVLLEQCILLELADL